MYFSCFPLLSEAQISLGITAGSNTGKFGGVEPTDASYAYRTGLNFGGLIAYRFNKDISLTLQPMYSQRGSNIEVGEDSRRDSLLLFETKIDFLIVPLFVRVDSDNGITYFISGLEFGIPLAAEISHDGESRDISEILKNIDILASIGMGFRFPLGKPDLLIELRYYQGLVNFNSGNGEDQGNIIFEDFKNSGFQTNGGVRMESLVMKSFRKYMIVFLLVPIMLAAQVDSLYTYQRSLPKLNDHYFMPNSNFLSPFVTTFFKTGIGGACLLVKSPFMRMMVNYYLGRSRVRIHTSRRMFMFR